MGRLQAATPKSVDANPVGPGVLIKNLVELTPNGVVNAMRGDTSAGIKLGGTGSAPGFTVSRDVTDRTEGVSGLNAPFAGAQVLNRSDVTMTADLVEFTHDNLQVIHPGLTRADWLSAAHAKLTVGTGNAAFSVTAIEPGTSALNIVVSTPAGSTTTVTVATNTVTVHPATGATAQDCVDAINETPAASALMQAGLPPTSDGLDPVVAATSTPLTGGSAGAKIGVRFKPTGFFPQNEYMRNLCFVLEGGNTNVMQIWKMDNVLQTDDLDYTPDDAGGVAAISCTFTGHVTQVNFDETTGAYIPPYEIFNLDPVLVV